MKENIRCIELKCECFVSAELEIYSVENKEGVEKYGVKNTVTRTGPSILHGNGYSKLTLNYLGNYVPNTWNFVDGCIKCNERHIDLKDKTPDEMPLVYIAVFIELNTPFLEEGLKKIHALDYPKERIHLFIHNNVSVHYGFH